MKMEGQDWFYSKKVKEHFLKPKNILKNEKEIKKFNGYGKVGNMKCGDIMEMWIKVENEKIIDCKWKTFGCASAIASTSMLSVMLTEKKGIKLTDALKITGNDIMKRLGGLPQIKIHCSVLGDQALREAIKNYEKNNSTIPKIDKKIKLNKPKLETKLKK
ncbi:MAG: iron-sulfur cluster assembly scaffold protein [Candidatus ainarchaeum sp.]|nr:iron-sulfur cluster assembly scaffold protein [Candidatus ainarchaeum sp.]